MLLPIMVHTWHYLLLILAALYKFPFGIFDEAFVNQFLPVRGISG